MTVALDLECERELELKYEDLDNRIQTFYIIDNIPEFDNKEIFWIRFENRSRSDEYISIMQEYCSLAKRDPYPIEVDSENNTLPFEELFYNVEFTKSGWYKGYIEEEKDCCVKYNYIYDVDFNDLLKKM